MKKTLSLLTLLLATHIPFSCTNEDDCGNFTPLVSKIQVISSSIGSLESDEFSDIVTNNFQTAAIRFEITEMEFSEIALDNRATESPFITSALACSPPEPELAYDITGISITGESDIELSTTTLRAGTALNELFKVRNHSSVTLGEFSNNLSENKWLFGSIGAELTLALIEQPEKPIEQRLTLRLEFSDGTFIETQTEIFRVN